MGAHAFIGTSGWNYSGWKDDFYARVPRKHWLEYYAEQFNALEVDGTFYHLLRENTARSWYERTPPDFHFAVKGHRYIIHVKRMEPPAQSLKLQRDSTAALGEKLAVILWQLPANLHKDIKKLATFLAMLDKWPEVRHAIEFRDSSWFDEEVAKLMARQRIAVCQSDAATWPLWDAVTTDLVFVRLHGHEATYSSGYERRSLESWAHRIDRWLGEGRYVHVYFDNDAKGYAPWNAATLAEIVGLASVPFDKSDFFARYGIRGKARNRR
ncbi:MAG TPA: DUF72 domain-containing protein [Candidatus Binataceae bacterium]|nr:DUF72 domain-containing protein [Candidatus Binataceae bacterium]